MNAPHANTLGVRLISDNLNDKAVLYWELSAVATSPASTTKVDSGNVSITGSDYTGWDGDNTFPFTFTASKLNVTIVS